MNEEKIETMLSQLIKMVGSTQAEQLEMKQDLSEMKQDLSEMKQELSEMKQDQKIMKEKLQDIEAKGEERHKEILDRFRAIETDQDFIWKKTAKNEREIAHIKGQLS